MLPKVISEKKVAGIATLPELHEHAIGIAEGAFKADHKAPFRWLVRVGAKKLIVLDTPWENEREKEASAALMRMFLRLFDADAYSFITEAWMGMIKDPTKYDGRPPSEMDPADREDILAVSSFDRHGASCFTRYGVSRPDTTKAKLLARDDWIEEMRTDGSMHWAGRMFNLFELERPAEDENKQAMQGYQARKPVQPEHDEEALAMARDIVRHMPTDTVLAFIAKQTGRMFGTKWGDK